MSDVSGNTGTRDWRAPLLALSAAIIALDRVTKIWVTKHVAEGDGITIIPHIFRITHVLNAGAAFSLFNNAPAERTRWLLTSLSIVVAVGVLIALLSIGRRFSITAVALALILGGALGNAWDRIQYKMVTDFLEVFIMHYHWPDFNVADSAIVCGGMLLFLSAFFESDARA